MWVDISPAGDRIVFDWRSTERRMWEVLSGPVSEEEERQMKTVKLIQIVILVLTLHAGLAAAGFRASVVKVDITPDPDTPHWLAGYYARQSTGVHDRLYHRIVVMHDGEKPFVLVSTDVVGFSPVLYDDFAEELERDPGIGREQLWWTVTHTHSAPEVGPPGLGRSFLGERYQHEWAREYQAFLRDSLSQGIRKALAGLIPARLAVGSGMSLANINRRAPGPDGPVTLGLNPEGAVDRKIGLLRLERRDGSPIARIANYAVHGTYLSGRNLEISGDVQGVVASYVEDKLGVPMLFINGAAGNIAPIYTFSSNFAYITKFNVLLGDRILDANRSIRSDESVEIDFEFGEIIVETPKFPGLKWPEDHHHYLRTTESGQELVRLPVRFLKIRKDTVLWAAPLELFCEYAIKIRNLSPFPNTLYFGYANGWLGYLPTSVSYGQGGYEIRVTPSTERAETDFTEGVVGFLQGMGVD